MVIVAVIALLALFSIVAIVLSDQDTRAERDPRDNPLIWAFVGRR